MSCFGFQEFGFELAVIDNTYFYSEYDDWSSPRDEWRGSIAYTFPSDFPYLKYKWQRESTGGSVTTTYPLLYCELACLRMDDNPILKNRERSEIACLLIDRLVASRRGKKLPFGVMRELKRKIRWFMPMTELKSILKTYKIRCKDKRERQSCIEAIECAIKESESFYSYVKSSTPLFPELSEMVASDKLLDKELR